MLGQELVSLKRIVDVLRVECPWDREQTARDIVSYTVEETFELADAVAGDDLGAVHGELGDLLLQVVILAMMLAERTPATLAASPTTSRSSSSAATRTSSATRSRTRAPR